MVVVEVGVGCGCGCGCIDGNVGQEVANGRVRAGEVEGVCDCGVVVGEGGEVVAYVF